MDKSVKHLLLGAGLMALLLVSLFSVGLKLASNGNTGSSVLEFSVFNKGLQIGDVPMNMKKLKLEQNAQTAFYTNTSGRTEFITNPEAYSGGTATSTYKLYVVATSTESFTAAELNRGTPSGIQLLSGWSLATSTTATTTDAILFAQEGGLAKSVYALPDGHKIAFILENVDIVSGVVEAATSTNRGVVPEVRFGVHR